MSRMIAAVAVVGVLALSACASTGVSNEAGGAVVGGILGGVLGSQVGKGSGQTAATIAGALIGGRVGQYMDETDRLRSQSVLESTRTGQSVSWSNPDTRHQYQMTPTRTYVSGSAPCREYSMDAWIDGRKETVTGTACRQPDGTWRTI